MNVNCEFSLEVRTSSEHSYAILVGEAEQFVLPEINERNSRELGPVECVPECLIGPDRS